MLQRKLSIYHRQCLYAELYYAIELRNILALVLKQGFRREIGGLRLLAIPTRQLLI
jgi:hypothetical protein